MTNEQIDDLLTDLDAIARNYDGYEYGLPISHELEHPKMREAVATWLAKVGLTEEGKR